MATTPIWADIVSSVTCNRLHVESVAPTGSDSHDFELSMRGADRVLGSRIVFANGLDLETDLTPLFERARESGVPVVRLGERLPGDVPVLEGDPHIWTDPVVVRHLVPVIADELDRLDLMDPKDLARCADDYSARLDGLVDEMDGILSVVPPHRRRIVSEHRNLGHFARRFDMEVVGTMIDSSSSLAEADSRHLDDLRAAMVSAGVSTVFVDVADSDAAARSFVADLGPGALVVGLYIETMPTGPKDDVYPEMMRTDAGRVANALAE